MTTSIDQDRTERELLDFLRDRTGDEWTAGRDLFSEGGLSSLFAMELVVHLENTFGIEISGADLQLANFRTVDTMIALVVRRRADAGE
jgi:methoxymalonate biosynthesis acyl carrier protein